MESQTVVKGKMVMDDFKDYEKRIMSPDIVDTK